MKKILLLIITVVLSYSSAFAQMGYDPFVSEVRGDTLLVKDYTEMESQPNSLVNVIQSDTTEVPTGRVYELKRDGWYPLLNPVTNNGRPMTIAGQANKSIVQTKDANIDGYPAVISGMFVDADQKANGNIRYSDDTTIKNVAISQTNTGGNLGWTFFVATAADKHLTLDGVMMESTKWVFAQSNPSTGSSLTVKNGYFVNMSGQPCRRNGGVWDNVNNNTVLMHVENTTHIMGSGMIYKMRGYPINRAIFNHNTFVNMSGQVFATMGYQSDFTVSNNLFVNSNVQAYVPGLDYGETDQDRLPHGIINVDSVRYIDTDGIERLAIDSTWIRETLGIEPTEFGPNNRHVLVTNNGVFWDDKLATISTQLNDAGITCPADEGGSSCVEGNNTWVPQTITMNSRSKSMFDDDEAYPYLQNNDWIEGGAPSFTDPAGLMTDALDDLIAWSVAAASVPSDPMAHWRATDNPWEAGQGFVFSDFPVLADLSYSNSQYLTASSDGQPIGDLNWFPAEKTSFDQNRDQHYAKLRTALETGNAVGVNSERVDSDIPVSIKLNQNYPNPFNPSTTISFNLPTSMEISLKVYDLLGREVATLINNEQHTAGLNNVTFDASNLASGMYIYELTSANFAITKKMSLIK